jgi:hypothetical protein
MFFIFAMIYITKTIGILIGSHGKKSHITPCQICLIKNENYLSLFFELKKNAILVLIKV